MRAVIYYHYASALCANDVPGCRCATVGLPTDHYSPVPPTHLVQVFHSSFCVVYPPYLLFVYGEFGLSARFSEFHIFVTSTLAPLTTPPSLSLSLSLVSYTFCHFSTIDYFIPLSFVFSQGSRRGEPLHSEASDFTSRLPPATFRAV